MADHGGFNHNHQSYRVVTKLEHRYPKWNGLNLTFETLEGIAKHETAYDRSAFREISEETGPGLEAQIANVADELAYNAHDLDDGLQSGLIHVAQLQDLEIWQRVVERIRVDGRLTWTMFRAITSSASWSGNWSTMSCSRACGALKRLAPGDSLDVQRHPEPVVRHSDEQQALNTALKDFLFHNMYRHFRIVRMQTRAEHCHSCALFASYLSRAAPVAGWHYRAKLDDEPTHRVVADYIASLTDRSALREYPAIVRSYIETMKRDQLMPGETLIKPAL